MDTLWTILSSSLEFQWQLDGMYEVGVFIYGRGVRWNLVGT